ncbi:MAG: ABC transporter ATP-binding protein [bacterium]|nr:ABC transporter ATP-binding protein [bacterium]
MEYTHALETSNLSKKFRKVNAVDNVSLQVPKGSIFAFIGPNGAGKTTTIKLLMNLLEPGSGSSSVLGVPSKKLGPNEWRRIGYVSENQQLPAWMTVEQFLAYCEPMYPDWDKEFCRRMPVEFDLPMKQKLKHLSRGMRMKAALLSSMAYRPELLVLDEPFTGLDPLVRDELIQGILDLSKKEQMTMFISSHDIHEVERLADWVGMIDNGSLKMVEKTETLHERFKKIDVILNSTDTITAPPKGWPETWLQAEQQGRIFSFFLSEYQPDESETQIKRFFPNCKYVDVLGVSLKDIFIVMAKTNRETLQGQS